MGRAFLYSDCYRGRGARVISLGYLRSMQDYNRWMNDRLYDCCEKLSDELCAQRRATHLTV